MGGINVIGYEFGPNVVLSLSWFPAVSLAAISLSEDTTRS